jgi:hypothetical protein
MSNSVSEVAAFVESCLGGIGVNAGPRSLGTIELSLETELALAAVVTALLIEPPTIGSTVPRRSFEAEVGKRIMEAVVSRRTFESEVDKRIFETTVAKRLLEIMKDKIH